MSLFKKISKAINTNKIPKGLILGSVYDLSEKVIKYGSNLQIASTNECYLKKSTWGPITRGVMERLHESIITYHRAIVCLAQNGWALNTQPLLRTMIDLIVNCAVIVEGDCEMRSFRYLVFELLKLDSTLEEKERSKKELKEQLYKYLNEFGRNKAEEYLNQQKRDFYWYSGIYRGPKEVLGKVAPTLLDAYEMGSSAVHGGQIGYKFFEKDRNLKDINPRKDHYSANLSIIFSTRYLLEFSLIRDNFEKLGLEHYYHKCLEELSGLRDLVENTKSHRALCR